MPLNSPEHRTHAINFVKQNALYDYTFCLPADSETDGYQFVQRMRVELSRMRKYVRDQGQVCKSFRMLLVSIEFTPRPNAMSYCTIVLRKTEPNAQIARDVAEVFGTLTGGDVTK